LAETLTDRPLGFALAKKLSWSASRVRLAKVPCPVSPVRSAKQPRLVLFMFKHCFDYDFPIGFVCGSWLRLRKYHCPLGSFG
jgi:hypothetical protein